MSLQTRIGRLESYLAPPQNADKAAVRATIVDLLENHSDYTEGLRAAAMAADCDPTLESLVAE